jgi:hypothetical protein
LERHGCGNREAVEQLAPGVAEQIGDRARMPEGDQPRSVSRVHPGIAVRLACVHHRANYQRADQQHGGADEQRRRVAMGQRLARLRGELRVTASQCAVELLGRLGQLVGGG